MAGTPEGGYKASLTNKAKYGADFFVKIGAKGGKKGRTGGFHQNRALASIAGRIGGYHSWDSRRPERLTPEAIEKREREVDRAYQHLLAVQERAARKRARG